MLKRTRSVLGLLIVLCMLLSLVPIAISAVGIGETFTYGNFNYKVNADGATVTLTSIAASALTGDVSVPEKVSDGSNEYTVTQLADAFKNQGDKTKEMTKLTLPDTITTFTGTATFYGCKFTSIHLPASLAGRLTKTFYFCNNLSSVTLPAGVTECYGTFGGGNDQTASSGVKTVYITGKNSVSFFADSGTIEARAWKNGSTPTIYYPYDGTAPVRTSASGSFNATVIKQDPPSTGFVDGNFKYETNGDGEATVTLASIETDALSGNITVPEKVSDGAKEYTVTRLGDAFKNKGAKTASMTSLTLPDTITQFTGTGTFYGCKFTSIHLPTNLTYAGQEGILYNTFQWCSKLTSITLPEGITKCWGTFKNSGVKTVYITTKNEVDFYEGSTTTDARAWDGATGVTIYYPNGGTAPKRTGSATVIEQEAPVTKFTFGDFEYDVNSDGDKTATLISIATDALSGDITVPETVSDGTNEYTVTRLGDAFKNQGDKTQDMTSLILPDTITRFTGTGTFYGCKFTSLHLPTNLIYAGQDGSLYNTFQWCQKLTSVTLPAGITKCWGTFKNSAVREVIIKSNEAVDFYGGSGTADARAWNDGTDGITIYYPFTGKVPVRTSGSFTADVIRSGVPVTIAQQTATVGDDNSISIYAKIINSDYIGDNATVICAIYDSEGTVYDVQSQAFSAQAGSTEEFTFDMSTLYTDKLKYAIYVFDEDIRPLSKVSKKALSKDIQTEKNNSKVNLYENFGGYSCWDKYGNQLNSPDGKGLTNIGFVDNSTLLPGEAYRSFTKITGGKATLEFDFSINEKKNGVGFRLLDGQDTVFGLVTADGNLCLEQPDGEKLTLMPYSATSVSKAYESGYYVKAELDLTEKEITSLRINGSIVAENKPFATDTNSIDAFDISTADTISVSLLNRMVKLYTNYNVYEMFYNYRNEPPEDWKFDKSGGKTDVYMINSRMPERYSMKFDTTGGAISGQKDFEEQSGSYVFETMVLQPVKRDGVSLSVKCGDDELFKIVSDGEKYSFVAKGTSTELYDYLPNVWYGLKVVFDTLGATADVYVNNKLVLEDIELDGDISSVDNILISADSNENPLIFDDVKLYQKKIYADDYVPEPVMPNVNKEYVIGMQMCTLWTPGQYNNGWDCLMAAPDRMSVLGAYDEGDSEVNDWEIKWMTEHGIDFQWLCAYPNIKYSVDAEATPYKPNMVRQGDAIYEGFMNARYSDKMKFAIIYEANTISASTDEMKEYWRNDFFEHTLPNWIEYYFKDPRYLKIDGRPIVAIYSMDNFFNTLGNTTEEINQSIKRMRNECIEAGVGDPYIVMHASSYPQNAFTKYANYDVDSVGLYGWMTQCPVKYQERIISAEMNWSNTNNLDFIPTLMPSYDLTAWDGEVGHTATKEGFKEELSWMKNTFAKTMDGRTTNKKLSKKLLNLASWNEYGEGHFIAPTVGKGFDYLDAVREVFVGGTSHSDELPTYSQKKRVNMMVDQDRKVYNITERPMPSKDNLVAKKTWNMSNSTDYSQWTNLQDISSMTRTSSGMELTPGNQNPQIELNTLPADTNLYDVTYIKVRMLLQPGLPYWSGGYIYFKTDKDGTYNNKKRVYFGGSSANLSSSTYYDFYIPVSKTAKWSGKLTGLKFQPGILWSGTNAKIKIASIELMSDTEIADGYKIVYGNNTVACENAPTNKDGQLMVPLQEVAAQLGYSVSYLGRTNEFLVKNGNIAIRLKPGDEFATKYNTNTSSKSSYTLATAPYAKSDAVNDIVFVPASMFSDIFGKTVTLNSKTITVK